MLWQHVCVFMRSLSISSMSIVLILPSGSDPFKMWPVIFELYKASLCFNHHIWQLSMSCQSRKATCKDHSDGNILKCMYHSHILDSRALAKDGAVNDGSLSKTVNVCHEFKCLANSCLIWMNESTWLVCFCDPTQSFACSKNVTIAGKKKKSSELVP